MVTTEPTTFAGRVLRFWQELEPPAVSEPGIELLDPYSSEPTSTAMAEYYRRFYNDDRPRVFVFGINPGRFGAGVTGVPFTDPIALATDCDIPNSFPPKRELSSIFVYEFIRHWGGIERFAASFYISAICPYGFVRDGKNVNYYDVRSLQDELRPYIVRTLHAQLRIGAHRDVAIVLGAGKNAAFFNDINAAEKVFDTVIPLDHPRFIMQYRRKQLGDYLDRYAAAFAQAEALSNSTIP
jgi:hypothetical protein